MESPSLHVDVCCYELPDLDALRAFLSLELPADGPPFPGKISCTPVIPSVEPFEATDCVLYRSEEEPEYEHHSIRLTAGTLLVMFGSMGAELSEDARALPLKLAQDFARAFATAT